MFKSAYSRFLSANPDRLHFAAHSHHFWPDCSRDAQLQYWDDSAKWVDQKWEHVMGTVLSQAKNSIAELIHSGSPDSITVGGNTHEFVVRLLSCFDPGKKIRILTTDSEFYSFARQASRLEETGLVEIVRVNAEPFQTFSERMIQALRDPFDLVFFSHVFFNSGFVVPDLERIVKAVSSEKTMIVIDGYHAFCAVPIDLSEISERVFYMGGGYKYAQAGEGACFLHVPARCELRPINTGWFAAYDELSGGPKTHVGYAAGGSRFAGATFDPSGWYRFNAVMDWWKSEGLTVERVHAHVQSLQRHFIEKVEGAKLQTLNSETLIGDSDLLNQGHFLTYRLKNAGEIAQRLEKVRVIVDHRGDRLRFGFGLYHEHPDIDDLVHRMSTVIK